MRAWSKFLIVLGALLMSSLLGIGAASAQTTAPEGLLLTTADVPAGYAEVDSANVPPINQLLPNLACHSAAHFSAVSAAARRWRTGVTQIVDIVAQTASYQAADALAGEIDACAGKSPAFPIAGVADAEGRVGPGTITGHSVEVRQVVFRRNTTVFALWTFEAP